MRFVPKTWLGVVAGLILLSVAPAWAQTPPVKNPTAVQFTSADHAAATGYEVDILVASSGSVLTTLTLGKGTVQTDGTILLNLNVQPIAFGSYRLRIRTVAGTFKSVDSVLSDVWERVPGAPTALVIK